MVGIGPIADQLTIRCPDNKSQRYIRAMKYMQKAAREQGDIISMLSVKWFWHYPIKEGFITCAGAESQNKTYTST